MTGRWFCPATFGEGTEPCGYQGRPVKVLRPRPSTKSTRICPACLSEVK